MAVVPDTKLIQQIKKENPDLPFEDILKIAKSQKTKSEKEDKGEPDRNTEPSQISTYLASLFDKPASKGIDIDEAVGYGFEMLTGIFKYLVIIIILILVGFFLVTVGYDFNNSASVFVGIFLIILAIIFKVALFIGVMYKLWVDILSRSRKQDKPD
tara:strand:- start:336 stop:803 length:468 start_codon:yes stop_codon:yes gene_type:complete